MGNWGKSNAANGTTLADKVCSTQIALVGRTNERARRARYLPGDLSKCSNPDLEVVGRLNCRSKSEQSRGRLQLLVHPPPIRCNALGIGQGAMSVFNLPLIEHFGTTKMARSDAGSRRHELWLLRRAGGLSGEPFGIDAHELCILRSRCRGPRGRLRERRAA